MTLEEFNRKQTNKRSDDPEFVRRVVRAMSTLPTKELYKSDLTAQKGSQRYVDYAVEQMCLRLGESPDSPGIQNFGTGLLQKIRDYPDKADVTVEEDCYNIYFDLLIFLAMLPTGFIAV